MLGWLWRWDLFEMSYHPADMPPGERAAWANGFEAGQASVRSVMEAVHEDPYPSRVAMEAAVELEVHSALGRVQTQTIGKVIQRAIDKALAR